MKLNYKKVGEGDPLVILHGLFGSLDNWMSLAKKLGEDFEVFIVDARNHGQSPHSEEFNYDIMADDVYEFLMQHNIIDPVILGHSMGGKTAMQFAMNYPTILSKLIVVDIAPKPYPIHHRTIIDGLFSLDFNIIKSRKEAGLQLSKSINEIGIRQFLLKNLHWIEKEQLSWRFNLPIINDQIESIGQGLQNIRSFEKQTLFIRGEKSNYILESDYQNIKTTFENCKIETIKGAGHWVHAENPQALLSILLHFLEH